MGNELSKYETEQVLAIDAWKKEEPSVVANAVHTVLKPVEWLVSTVIPEKAIRGLLDGANYVAEKVADEGDILRDGQVSSIEGMRNGSLERCDELANSVHNWAIGLATVEGGGTGAFGLFGMAADIPLVITLALRTIHKTGLCYGYRLDDEQGKQIVLGILAASGANTVQEKASAMLALQQIKILLKSMTWKAMKRAAENQASKEFAILAIKTLAKQIGVNMTKRKALQAIPVVGAIVGASVNAWFIKEVGWAARREFQERWLFDNDKVHFNLN